MGKHSVCRNSYEIRLLQEFPSLEAEWRSLYEACEPRNPFLSYEWTAACWAELGRGCAPFVVAARHEGSLVGLAPFRLQREAGCRVLRFLGDGRSDYLGFLQSPQHPQVAAALLEGLAAERRRWDLAILRQLAEPYTCLAGAVPPDRLRARRVEGTVAPYLAHAGDWQSLRASGPGWLRKTSKEAARFERGGGTARRLCGQEAAEQVDQVAAIERGSWKGREGVARFQTPAARELLRRALAGLGARGEMELWLAWILGEPAAFEINFVTPERIWLYQGAYREEFGKHSPGGVLDYLSIRRAWDAGAREYDFLSGDEAYKLHRTNAQRPLHYLALFPASVRGYLSYARVVGVRWRLKGWAPARAALQLWVRRRGLLRDPRPGAARLRSEAR